MTTASGVKLRPAREADVPRLAAIFLRCFRDAYRGVLDDRVLDALELSVLEQRWRELVGAHDVVVAIRTDDAVGMARFGADPDDPSRGHLFSLYVDPASAGAGVGRMLLEHVSSRLAANGFARATLWVFEQNERALRFYRAAGWRPTGAERIEDEWGAPELQLESELA